jgi:acetyltransferase-like isoleucine patch superfamily enzyme
MHVQLGITNSNKAKHILSPYTVCVKVNGFMLEFARGSFSSISSVRLYGSRAEHEDECILRVGQFIERNHTSHIILGGEHLSDKKEIINTFQTAEVIRASLGYDEVARSRAHRKTVIEDNVVLSANTTILNGALIRQNSLLAAGAVTNREHPSNSILAGVPAKEIGSVAAPKAEWWNFSFDGIVDYLKTGNSDQQYDQCHKIKICFRSELTNQNTISGMELTHLCVDNRQVKLSDLDESQISYLNGNTNEDGKFWVSDQILLSLI